MSSRFEKKILNNFSNYVVAPINHKKVINANESYFNILEIPEIESDFNDAFSVYSPSRYPETSNLQLRKLLADYVGENSEQIIIGNGADEIIAMIVTAFLDDGEFAVSHRTTFEMYEITTQIHNGRFEYAENKENFEIDIEALIQKANEVKAKIVFLCTPNNPTGYKTPKYEIIKLIESVDSLVVIDEAYIEFSSDSLVDLVNQYDNLIVLRTLSKAFGIAGLRCGYAVSNIDIIETLKKVKPPYNVNSLSALFACIALRNWDEINPLIEGIKFERDHFYNQLIEMGVEAYKSDANFILLKPNDWKKLKVKLDELSILPKYYDQKKGLEGFVRITITDNETNLQILQALGEIYEDNN